MKAKDIEKKIKTPIKIVQDVDDKYLLDYKVIGGLIDIALNKSHQEHNNYAEEGKTYYGRFSWNGHIYDASIHVFKKYLEVKITSFDAIGDEKKNGKKKS